MGDFKTGTFVYGDRPKGPHKLTFEGPEDLSRESHQVFVGESRRTYFSPRADGKVGLVAASSMNAGLAGFIHFILRCGQLRTNAACSTSLPWDEAAAREALADLRLAEWPCPGSGSHLVAPCAQPGSVGNRLPEWNADRMSECRSHG
jgi:hypothetical protein